MLVLNAVAYPGAHVNYADSSYEWKNKNNELHNISGPAKITPIGNGCNKVQFYVNGQEMNRTAFKFFYPNART